MDEECQEFRPIEALLWINEIESAKSFADLRTSYAATGAELQTNFEILDSNICKWSQEDQQQRLSRVFVQKAAALRAKRSLSRRQVAWMIYEDFKVREHRRIRLGGDLTRSYTTLSSRRSVFFLSKCGKSEVQSSCAG